MTNLDELELEAYKGGDLPENLSFCENYYFLSLRSLYGDFRDGRISREKASAEKARLKAEFLKQTEIERLRIEAYKEMQENIKKTEQIRIDSLKGEDLTELTKALLKYVSRTSGNKHFYTAAVKKYGL